MSTPAALPPRAPFYLPLVRSRQTSDVAYMDDDDEGDDLPVALWKQRRGPSTLHQ